MHPKGTKTRGAAAAVGAAKHHPPSLHRRRGWLGVSRHYRSLLLVCLGLCVCVSLHGLNASVSLFQTAEFPVTHTVVTAFPAFAGNATAHSQPFRGSQPRATEWKPRVRRSSNRTRGNVRETHPAVVVPTQPPTKQPIHHHNQRNDDPMEAITRFVLEGTPNQTERVCPLDVFFHRDEDCHRRRASTVCIFPTLVLKKVDRSDQEDWDREMEGFRLLSEPHPELFPKLIYRDDDCLTMLVENVRPFGITEYAENAYTANYTHYEQFYERAFAIFTANRIYPRDLNVCCNTLVNGERMKIIDFGEYLYDQDPATLPGRNEQLLENLRGELREALVEEYRKRKKKQKDHAAAPTSTAQRKRSKRMPQREPSG